MYKCSCACQHSLWHVRVCEFIGVTSLRFSWAAVMGVLGALFLLFLSLSLCLSLSLSLALSISVALARAVYVYYYVHTLCMCRPRIIQLRAPFLKQPLFPGLHRRACHRAGTSSSDRRAAIQGSHQRHQEPAVSKHWICSCTVLNEP